MSRIYVALDLETTGLHAERDAIIEVGAVKFRVGADAENTTVASWSTFVNPGRPVPYRTSRLTGITQADVERAPRLSQALEQLGAFVGNYPVVGHNIAFDLSFVQRHGCLRGNASLDTFELASILLPQAARYSLAHLAENLGLELESHHRALEDATAAQQLFTRLWQVACRLPRELITTIGKVAAKSDWSLRSFFFAVARQQGTTPAEAWLQPGAQPVALPEALSPSNNGSVALDADLLSQLLTADGAVGRRIERFEERPQQLAMLRAIVQAFEKDEHLLVEAGTGTGKSLAYLLPAIVQAVRTNSPVVVSTNTINLQDQLFNADLPVLADALAAEGVQFRAALLKGRTNYLCVRRLALAMQSAHFSEVQARALARILVWLPVTQTGDRSEVALQNDEESLWQEVCADPQGCPPAFCTPERGCFFKRARAAAMGSHILIVNHALLLSDLVAEEGSTILPQYDYAIVDEAHHLEARATEHFGAEVSLEQVEAHCLRLHDARGPKAVGLLPSVSSLAEKLHTPQAADARREAGLLARTVQQAATEVTQLGETIREVLNNAGGANSDEHDHLTRLTTRLRHSSEWRRVVDAAAQVAALLDLLAARVAELHLQLQSGGVNTGEELVELLAHLQVALERDARELRRILVAPESEDICWISRHPVRGEFRLHHAPLHPARQLAETLFQPKRSVILTSATLQIESSFEYVRERLGLAVRFRELAVGSPFDYRRAALVYVTTDLPEPNSPNYAQTLHRAVIDLARATRGRMLVLLTSKSQLRAAYRAISDPLANDGIVVLGQYMDGGRRQLLERFKTIERCVLLGTQSFWEGVDVPGPALSCLVIARLPFPVPSDPIFSARSESYDDPFFQYAVPQTVIRFRQGFGRLIRSREDRGLVALLDSRVSTKSYGSIFLNSLPAADIRFGLCRDLPPLAERWLAEE